MTLRPGYHVGKTYSLPPPSQMGLDAQYASWYPQQDTAFQRVLLSQAPLVAACLPTGSGKSVIGALLARLHATPSDPDSTNRAIILVSTKLLQDQEERGFSNLVSIRGQGNYECRWYEGDVHSKHTVEDGPCHAGEGCRWRGNGCYYYDALREAQGAKKPLLSNYAYFLSQSLYGQGGLGEPFTLRVCDEAHLLNDELERFFSLEFSGWDLGIIGDMAYGESIEEAAAWAKRVFNKARQKAEGAMGDAKSNSSPERVRRAKRLERLVQKVGKLAGGLPQETQWLVDSSGEGFKVVPLWPGRLYRWPRKTLFMSATITEKTLDYLLSPEQRETVEFMSFPSPFPVENRPVVHVKTVDMSYGRADLGVWCDRIDQIIDRRLDRKGMVHTTSYDRARYLLQNSRHRGLMIGHDEKNIGGAVKRFKLASAPAVLVSPSATTGVDLPGDECRYIIVGKIPFRGSTDVLEKARRGADPDWSNYQAAQTIVQECGRAVRSVDDWAEVIIVDDAWQWFVKRARGMFPNWFLESYKGSLATVPDPIVKAV